MQQSAAQKSFSLRDRKERHLLRAWTRGLANRARVEREEESIVGRGQREDQRAAGPRAGYLQGLPLPLFTGV